MIPATTSRVAMHTAPHINDRIRHQIEENVAYTAAAGPEAIALRLAELDREWDVERALEANASSLMVVGLALGTWVDRRWFLLPAVVGSFLLQHAVQGWCPPIPLFRRLGLRTQTEIDYERYALKALRGDFQGVAQQGDRHDRASVRHAIEAAQR